MLFAEKNAAVLKRTAAAIIFPLPIDPASHRYTVGSSADISAASDSLTWICVCTHIIPDPQGD